MKLKPVPMAFAALLLASSPSMALVAEAEGTTTSDTRRENGEMETGSTAKAMLDLEVEAPKAGGEVTVNGQTTGTPTAPTKENHETELTTHPRE